MHRTSLASLAVRLAALIYLAAGCADGAQPAEPAVTRGIPAADTPPKAVPPIAAPPAFPALSRPGQIYRAPDSLYDRYATYHQSSLASRYVLYDSSTFGLQFSSARFGFFEYTGHYARADSVLTFNFDLSNPEWTATGIMRGESLYVTYNLWASMSDFVDGVYVRSNGP